jgi:hypothetical protein
MHVVTVAPATPMTTTPYGTARSLRPVEAAGFGALRLLDRPYARSATAGNTRTG